MRFFKLKEQVKRNDTGEHVTIVEVLPLAMKVFYRIESENGDTTLVSDAALRPLVAGR